MPINHYKWDNVYLMEGEYAIGLTGSLIRHRFQINKLMLTPNPSSVLACIGN